MAMPPTQGNTTAATNEGSTLQPLLVYPESLNNQGPTQNPKELICGPHCTICLQATLKKELGSNWEENSYGREEKDPKINVATIQDVDYNPPSLKYITVQDQKEEEERHRRLEYLNDKYGLDYYSSSQSDFESDHEYATLV